MILIILYGNADIKKREYMAKRIMFKNPNILVQYPEICLPNQKSFEEEEKELMKLANLNLIFLESEASSYELAMMKTLKLPYKIIYADFNSKGSKNYLLKNSGFINNFIKRDDTKNKNVINIKPKKINIVKENNLLTDVRLEYDINNLIIKMDSSLTKTHHLNEATEAQLKDKFLIVYIRLKYLELFNYLKKETIENNVENLNILIQVFEKNFKNMFFEKKNQNKGTISKAIWNITKKDLVKTFLMIKDDDRTAEKILEEEEYLKKAEIKKQFEFINNLIVTK